MRRADLFHRDPTILDERALSYLDEPSPPAQENVLTRYNRECTQIAASLSTVLGFPTILSNLPDRIRKLSIVPDDSLHQYPLRQLPIKTVPCENV